MSDLGAMETPELPKKKKYKSLQIFNIETKQKVKSHVNNEDIVFWKWITDTTLGMVTDTAVYHWSIADTTTPQKVFDRHATLAGCQIINYRISADEKWMVLIGISGNSTNPSAFKVKGSMQLYSRERGVSQPIEGHAAAFAEVKLDGHQHPTKLFAFSVRSGNGAKVRCATNTPFGFALTHVNSSTSSRLTIRRLTLCSQRRLSMSTSLPKLRMISPWPCKSQRSMVLSTSRRNTGSSTSTTSSRAHVFT